MFLLPSCFTAAVWRETAPVVREEPLAVDTQGTWVATNADGGVVAFAVRLGAATGPFGPEAAGCWLWLYDLDWAPRFTIFLLWVAEHRVRDVRLRVVLNEADWAPNVHDRATVALTGQPVDPTTVDPGVLRGGFVSTGCRFRVRREVEPPPTPWPEATAVFAQSVRSTSVGQIAGAVALTPVSVACDIVTSPLQLIALIATGRIPAWTN
jgi:hypothetical protein